jgi:Leucine-rich repeat (LRR) protein
VLTRLLLPVDCRLSAHRLILFFFSEDNSQDDNFRGKITPLKGMIPSEIAQLTSLQRLIISDMEIGGPILEYLTEMPSLSYLALPSNNFTGSIPATFSANHRNLSYCDLTDNQITGGIPNSFGDLQLLNTLKMSNNKLKGTLPSELSSISARRTFQ